MYRLILLFLILISNNAYLEKSLLRISVFPKHEQMKVSQGDILAQCVNFMKSFRLKPLKKFHCCKKIVQIIIIRDHFLQTITKTIRKVFFKYKVIGIFRIIYALIYNFKQEIL